MNFINNNIKVYLIILLSSFVLIDYESAFLLFNGLLTFNHIISLIIPVILLSFILFFLYFVIDTFIFKIILSIAFAITLILMIPLVVYLLMFDEVATYTSFINLIDSGMNNFLKFLFEKIEFFDYIFIGFTLVIPFLLIYFLPTHEERISIYSYILSYLIIGLILFIVTFPNLKEIGYVSLYYNYSQAKNDISNYNNYIKNHDYNYEFTDVKNINNSKKNLFVLIIGDSSSRSRLGLYGYKRDTTPFLGMHKSDLYIFNDVISSSLNRGDSIYDMLTFKNKPIVKSNLKDKGINEDESSSVDYINKEKERLGEIYPSIIDLFKNANFKTYWISNQHIYNPNNLKISSIAKKADKSIYLNNTYWQKELTSKYDGEVIESFKSIIDDNATNKFIVIHLYGNQYPYIDRTPSDFNKFKTNKFLLSILPNTTYRNYLTYNSYDNSIYYVDNVINSFINILHKKKNLSSYVLYTSSYGEDVLLSSKDKFYYHNEEYNSKYMYEVPFIIWFSNTYKRLNNRSYSRLEDIKAIINRPYLLNRLAHSIADISNIDGEEVDYSNSIFSRKFKFEERIVNSINFDEKVSDNVSSN